MNLLAAIRRYLDNVNHSRQILGEIREGIAKHGCHILYKMDLETFFSDEPRTDENMRLLVEKFGADYGFKVQLSVKQMTALFRPSTPV